MAHLRTDAPLDGWHWQSLLTQVSAEEAEAVITEAETLICPEQIATGAGREHGLGAEYQRHTAVDTVLTAVAKRPGVGMAFIVSALRSPVIRNRGLAARTLEQWGRAQWPSGAEEALRSAAAVEPHDKNLELMRRLLVSAS